MAMLKSCQYCGGIHSRGYQCARKPKYSKRPTRIDKFRWTKAWQRKRKQINERDKYLCQVCIRELYNTTLKYNFNNLGVHHIVPIVEDWDKRLDDDNLVCLCNDHHKMADSNEIPRQILLDIAFEQEMPLISPPGGI